MSGSDRDTPDVPKKGSEAWKAIQEKTLLNWVNDRLRGNLKVGKKQLKDVAVDLEDGLILLELIEKLNPSKPVGRYHKNPKQKIQMIDNLNTVLKYISAQNIKLVNIGPQDIHGGNVKLILGLLWTLIQAYQIKFKSKKISTKKAMLSWTDSIIPEYEVGNFTTDWNDGRNLCGVVDHIRPGACPNHQALDPTHGLENCRLGMDLAERLLDIPKVIDPEDLNNPLVDERSVMTYLSYFCAPANTLLLDWIRKKIPANDIRNFSTDWNNGINLGALGEACFPGLCPDWEDMVPTNAIKNNERLLKLMKERLELETPISAAELADPKVDELIVATYLSQFRNAKLKAFPEEFGLRVPNLAVGAALIKEPVSFEIELSEQTANLKDSIQVSAHGPSADVKVNLKPKGKYNLEAVFVPTEAGSYDIMAMFNDENISGSPFHLPVADPSRCSIFGDIPSEMQVGKEEMFSVKVREAGLAKLTCSFDSTESETSPETASNSATSPVLDCTLAEQENQQYSVNLVPKKIGQEKVCLKWANVDIPRTPFEVNVCDASKASVSEIASEGKVGDMVTFKVSAPQGECGEGELKIVPRGPSANYTPNLEKGSGDDDGSYSVSFVPWEVGPHRITVHYGGGAVPNSPFSMNIVAAPDAKTCSASGKGLKKAYVGEKTSFKILSPKSGLLEMDPQDPPGLEVTVQSPTETAQADITDNKDGSYKVEYTPLTPGNYDINVKFFGKHIPGSPFNLDVVPSADASACKAYGPALHPNSLHIAGNPLDMFVDTTEAGTGDLRVVITGPDDSRPKVFIANEEGIFSIKWDVAEPGRYQAHIWWAEQYIPGAPFKIKVSPGPNAGLVKAYGPGLEPGFEIGKDPSDFTIETKDAGIGTLTIRVHGVKGAFKIQAQPTSEKDPRTLKAVYNPTEPGDYIIAIRWSKTHIPGSPFKINIREPPKPEKKKVTIATSNGEGGDETPKPTPLAIVDEKKKGKKVGMSSSSQIYLAQHSPDPLRGQASTFSLPGKPMGVKVTGLSSDEAIRQKQIAMLRQRGMVPGMAPPPPGGVTMATGERVTGSPATEAKKKKKKF